MESCFLIFERNIRLEISISGNIRNYKKIMTLFLYQTHVLNTFKPKRNKSKNARRKPKKIEGKHCEILE